VIAHNHITGWQREEYERAFTFKEETASSLYTSTRDEATKTDDGKPLLFTHDGNYRVDGLRTNYDAVLTKATYVRPTTVLLSGNNTIDKIEVGDVEWYGAYMYGNATKEFVKPFWMFSGIGCSHFTGWVSYYRTNVTFDTISIAAGMGEALGLYSSGRYVDAAVRLLAGADVCVKGDVADKTKIPYSINTGNTVELTETDAVLVLPGLANDNRERSNFRLKIGGDALMLHTQDTGVYVPADPLVDGYLYSDANDGTGPGAKFPIVQTEIYLSSGTASYDEVAALEKYTHPHATNTWETPYTATKGSVYGVNGLYEGGTKIYTRAAADTDTTSIIEIGSRTNNQDKFNIYSGGMLKNFRSECVDPCDTLNIGNQDGKAPVFTLSNDSMPLYIINDGSCCENAGIAFNGAGSTALEAALSGTANIGDLHVQANGFIRFKDAPVSLSLAKNNEIRVLADNGYINVEPEFTYKSADPSAYLTFWAKGGKDSKRGATDLGCAGPVKFDGAATFDFSASNEGDGLLLLRSENANVLFDSDLTYESGASTDSTGEVMIQAGQDIYAQGAVDFDTKGQKSILFEAKNTIHLAGVNITKSAGTRDSVTFKAGYDNFSESATVSEWTLPASCFGEGNYTYRQAGQPAPGADIWLGGAVKIDLTATTDPDTVPVMLRAFNSIYIDSDFTYENNGSGKGEGTGSSPVTLYAETGNVEAGYGKEIGFTFSEKDSSALTIQAGNQLGDICMQPARFNDCWDTQGSLNAEYDGNILLWSKLNVESAGTGSVLLSAARDLETQTGGKINLSYANPGLKSGNVTLTAGRHIETHDTLNISYTEKADSGKILIQAGRLNENYEGSDNLLCKMPEAGTCLMQPGSTDKAPFSIENMTDVLNGFARGGSGNGSIFAFAPINIKYEGMDTVKMLALDGDIVSDPYLHRGGAAGYPGGAAITFNNTAGSGITLMKAIDIKLHDILSYTAESSADGMKNGQFQISAFDSVLTRSLKYVNPADTGSVFITAAKYKAGTACTAFDCSAGTGGIHQGHIILGYGADPVQETRDSIIFDYSGNTNTEGANIHILAGFEGFEKNVINGKASAALFTDAEDKGKGYGGNITFDYMEFYMPTGKGSESGYTEIRTPNGNIWGKDSILYRGIDGDFLIDAGLGSVDDKRALLWKGENCHTENILGTQVPNNCGAGESWRTGNIMLKGARLNFGSKGASGSGTGNAIFRTREGYIDVYDAFTADSMSGSLLVYAGTDDGATSLRNSYGDVSVRDFAFTAIEKGGSVFFGADDNIMLNYGNSNAMYQNYGRGGKGFPGNYDLGGVNTSGNPYYTPTEDYYTVTDFKATYRVSKDGYLFYRNPGYTHHNSVHRLYRGGAANSAGNCVSKENGAREFLVNFDTDAEDKKIQSGGFAAVASNYIDVFTKFTYFGGEGSGLGAVPGMSNLHGEDVGGYGLYMKSRYNAEGRNLPEARRASCEDCGKTSRFPVEGSGSSVEALPEMTYIGFHDDARIYPQNQKSLIEAPVIEFFGHTELNTDRDRGAKTKLTLKGDSLIFHDSVIFDGTFGSNIELVPYTTDATLRNSDMRYGVINDRGESLENYKDRYLDLQERQKTGPAIEMEDRGLPVIELGYQRCTAPGSTSNAAPNGLSEAGLESVPQTGGDVILAFKNGFKLPVLNTAVANNARISFLSDEYDGVQDGEYVNAFIRTDLLRIRNRVEFYTDPSDPNRSGRFMLANADQMGETMNDAGLFTKHLHMEPGSELSLPGENSLIAISSTVVGGYGNIHENLLVKSGGILAPGRASLMEGDCQTYLRPGRLRVHNLVMEADAILRISIANNRPYRDENGNIAGYTQADTIAVDNTAILSDKVTLVLLPETENLDDGSFLFLEYGDAEGSSVQGVRNMVLAQERFREKYFALDFSVPGKVYLCVTKFRMPEIQRYVDLPENDGVRYNYVRVNGEQATHNFGRNYVNGHQDFEVNLTWSGRPLEVNAYGYYSHTSLKLDTEENSTYNPEDGSVTYIIRKVVQPWTISFGPNPSSAPWVGNENIENQKVWSYRNTLYVNSPVEEVVSIYNITGVLNRKVEIPPGTSKLVIEKGMYIVTLKDGSVYKIVIQ
jgi:hypothetical protein